MVSQVCPSAPALAEGSPPIESTMSSVTGVAQGEFPVSVRVRVAVPLTRSPAPGI
ncbi:hypothetical protein DSECCO2_307110 [anaerobic digester metagenome]